MHADYLTFLYNNTFLYIYHSKTRRVTSVTSALRRRTRQFVTFWLPCTFNHAQTCPHRRSQSLLLMTISRWPSTTSFRRHPRRTVASR